MNVPAIVMHPVESVKALEEIAAILRSGTFADGNALPLSPSFRIMLIQIAEEALRCGDESGETKNGTK